MHALEMEFQAVATRRRCAVDRVRQTWADLRVLLPPGYDDMVVAREVLPYVRIDNGEIVVQKRAFVVSLERMLPNMHKFLVNVLNSRPARPSELMPLYNGAVAMTVRLAHNCINGGMDKEDVREMQQRVVRCVKELRKQ